MDQVPFCPCFLKISLWRVCLREEVNLRAAAQLVHRGGMLKEKWAGANQNAMQVPQQQQRDAPPHCKPHPEKPAAPISLNRPGLDRIHALPVRLGITTSRARCTAIIEMGTLPAPARGWSRHKHSVLDGCTMSSWLDSSLQVPVWPQWAGAAQPAHDEGSDAGDALSHSGSHLDECDLQQGNCHSSTHT